MTASPNSNCHWKWIPIAAGSQAMSTEPTSSSTSHMHPPGTREAPGPNRAVLQHDESQLLVPLVGMLLFSLAAFWRVSVFFVLFQHYEVSGVQEEVQGELATVWRDGCDWAVLCWSSGHAVPHQESADQASAPSVIVDPQPCSFRISTLDVCECFDILLRYSVKICTVPESTVCVSSAVIVLAEIHTWLFACHTCAVFRAVMWKLLTHSMLHKPSRYTLLHLYNSVFCIVSDDSPTSFSLLFFSCERKLSAFVDFSLFPSSSLFDDRTSFFFFETLKCCCLPVW